MYDEEQVIVEINPSEFADDIDTIIEKLNEIKRLYREFDRLELCFFGFDDYSFELVGVRKIIH